MAAPIISNNDPLAYTCNSSSHDTANLPMASGAASAAATSPAASGAASAAAISPATTTSTHENNPHHHPTTTNNPERRQHYNNKSRGGRRGSSTLGMAAQKEIWKLEQEVIAALVRVEPDPPPRPTMDDSSSNSSMLYNSVFHLIRDNHEHDMFSFSTAPELYGGVDVSFPISSRNNKTGAAASSNNTRRLLFSSTSDENEDRMDDDGEDDDANQMQPAAAEKETMADNDETTIKDEQEEEQAVAVYVIIDRRTMTVVYHDHLFFDLEVPYIPTFLAFREIAPLEELVQRQVQHHPQVTPEAILVDGNGILHPRHAGLACFLGTRTDIPTIGIAKSLLHQDHDDNGGGGGSWTRESVDESVDEFVQKVHTIVGQNQNQPQLAHQLARHRGLIMKTISLPAPSNNNNNSSSNKRHHHHHDNSTPTTSRSSSGSDGDPADDDDDVAMYPAVAAAAATNIVHSTTTSRKNGSFDRKQALQDLAPFCCGLAVPLVTAAHHADMMDDEDEDEDEDDADDTNRFPVLGCALVGHGGQIAATSHSAPHGGSSKPIFVSVGHKVSLQQSVQIAASLSLARIPEPVRQADLLGREIMRQKAAAAAAAATATSVTSTGNASPGKETKI